MKLPWIHRKHVAALQRELDDLKSLEATGLHVDGSGFDMSVSGPSARIIAGMWVDFFEQNCGDNFVTMSMRVKDPWWKFRGRPPRAYTVTVQREGGESPAEQLIRLKAENASLRLADSTRQNL